ncbi:MAG: hypothetical protein INR62_06305 [Rhodospirillales bacterium]|nr:hypothetical protein [Acetobacter sp.]
MLTSNRSRAVLWRGDLPCTDPALWSAVTLPQALLDPGLGRQGPTPVAVFWSC